MSNPTQNIESPDSLTPAATPVATKQARPARKAVAKAASKPAVKAVPKVAGKKTVSKVEGKPAAKPAASVKAAKALATPVKATANPPAKTASKASPKRATKPTAPIKSAVQAPKAAKIKLIRDRFTIPSDEYAVLGQLKQRALSREHPARKSELLRAGIKLLSGLNDAALLRALKNVPTIKTGRPKSKKYG